MIQYNAMQYNTIQYNIIYVYIYIYINIYAIKFASAFWGIILNAHLAPRMCQGFGLCHH